MKRITLLLALLLTATTANAAGTFYDLDAELKSAHELIYKEKYRQAIRILETAIDSDAANADAWNLLGYASRKQGDLEQSALAYDKALSINPKHKDALEYQGELFLMFGDRAAAEANLAKLKSLCPDGCDQLDVLQAAIVSTL
jgi:tetratricopeptide (TPR) repeat protein